MWRKYYSCILSVFMAALFCLSPSLGFADPVQMLPPVGEDSLTVCPQNNPLTNNLLIWNGKDAIACTKNISASNGTLNTTNLQTANNVVAQGTVQVGGADASCSSTNEGAIRYKNKTFEGCDGTAWKPLGAGGAGCAGPQWSTASTYYAGGPLQHLELALVGDYYGGGTELVQCINGKLVLFMSNI